MRVLSRMNGWQRIWLVLTVLALVIGGIFYPYFEVYVSSSSNYEYRRSLIKDLQAAECKVYRDLPASKLIEPSPNTNGEDCVTLYYARIFSERDIYPYSIETYDKNEADRSRKKLFVLIGVMVVTILIASGLLYFAGVVTAWIRQGFSQPV